ncbi:MAG: hypothetical protein LBS17_00425 [Actinomycetes bacterium]|jgi:hypothetical protein|nr:hypothetical protein [Actinomycetes bacterium]
MKMLAGKKYATLRRVLSWMLALSMLLNPFTGLLGSTTPAVAATNDDLSVDLVPDGDHTPSGNQYELSTGEQDKLSVTVVYTVSNVNYAMVVIPVPNASTSVVQHAIEEFSTAGATLEFHSNFSYSIGGTTHTEDCLVFTSPALGGAGMTSFFELSFWFQDGMTPDDTLYNLQAYVLEAQQSGGNIVPVSGGAHNQSAAYQLKADAGEELTVTKTIQSYPPPAQVFPNLSTLSYGEAYNAATLTYEYKLAVASTRSGLQTGRLYMQNNSVIVEDVLSGYLPGAGAPTAVEIHQGSTSGPSITPAITVLSSTSQRISFTVPTDIDGLVDSADYYLVVKYDRSAYIKMQDDATPPLTAPVPVSNAATIKYTPKATNTQQTSAASTVGVAFGYQQGQATFPDLTIRKKIRVSGAAHTYTEYWHDAYQSAGDVVFRLTPQPSGTAQFATVDSTASDALAAFNDLRPGTYLLSESTGINVNFPTMTPVTVVVGQPDQTTGIAPLTVDGVDYTASTAVYEVENASATAARIEVNVYQQVAYSSSESPYTNCQVTLVRDLGGGTSTIMGTQVADSSGNVAFENLVAGTTYRLVFEDHTADGYATPTFTTLNNVDQANLNVTPAAPQTNVYTATYTRAMGGFRMGKLFQSPDGNNATVGTFSATFELHDLATDALVGTPFTVNSATVATVSQEFPTGTYVLKETGLSADSAILGEYTPLANTGTSVTVTITAGSYTALPTGPSTIVNSQGQFINTSNYG